MSRVGVPADFGVENLDSVVHGNVTLLLSDGLNMKANSMILAINSPVFRRIFIEQEQTIVDFKTFDAGSVRLFIRSLYSGKCHFALMSTEEVQEVMEASEAMDVVWLREKCKQYQLERRNSISPAIPVIERPSRPNSVASMSRDRPSSRRSNHRDDTSEGSDRFRKKSLFDLKGELSDMDLRLPITPSSEEVPTTSDEARSTQSKDSVPTNSRGKEQPADYKRIRRTVTCSSELESDTESTTRHPRLSDSDHRLSGASSRQSSVKERKRSLVSVVSKPTRLSGQEPAHPFRDSNPELPNLFWSYRDTLGPLVKNKTALGDILEVLQSCREVGSLYLLFEALDLIEYNKPFLKVSVSELKLISELRRRRRWGRVAPQFLENCSFYNRYFVDSEELCMERKELVSRTDSKKIPDSLPPYSIRLEDLLRAVRVVEFQFKHPAIQSCTRRGKCGFLLQLTGETQRNRSTQRDRSTLLHVRLLRSARFYTNSKVHYHDDVMSPDKMHLVMEEHFTTRSATSGTNKTTYVSWRGRPFLDRHHKSEMVTWGDLQIPSQRHAKLVVYYDTTEDNRDTESSSPRCKLQFNRAKRKKG